MPRNDWYRQCHVWRTNPEGKGIETTTTYLPDNGGLHVGARVRFKNHRGDDWSDGWRVSSVGQRVPGDAVEAQEDEYRHHRKRTDV